MNKSDSIVELSKALVKFNGEVSKIAKDSANPHFRNKYASLDQIVDEIRPLLHKNGLSILQFPGGDGEKLTMTTVLMHESGEWIQSEALTLIPAKKDPQGIGSATTYGRRYQLSAFLSLNTGEDDDGNDASTPPAQPNVNNSKEAVLKAKWQQGKGSLEGFDEWYQQQKQAGYTDAQMDTYLTKLLKQKGA
ncbi:ERF family protein [Brevibacillus sp. M2.1A]|uniref:ERF family protein n=1 Tax=Brevibacillus sp. M2.1A TaxID=2738980 RepID=UPI00156B787E|nr:ERF family protein [Brevibacillus sp. M2.1A]MCC8435434.1 ERF family protein [Brevibacillus sp. M2.1A]